MVNIEEVESPTIASTTKEAETMKAQANDLFKKKEYKHAAGKYGEALAVCKTEVLWFVFGSGFFLCCRVAVLCCAGFGFGSRFGLVLVLG
jgi:hypothetical protein